LIDKLIAQLMKQPIIVFFVLVWVIGFITNMIKAQKKASEKRAETLRPTPVARSESSGSATQNRIAQQGSVVSIMGTGQQPALPERRTFQGAVRGAQGAVSQATGARATGGGFAANAPSRGAPQVIKSAEEIAREMRRVLGLEPEDVVFQQPARATLPPVLKEPELRNPAMVRLRAEQDRQKHHVESHLGESMRDRHMAKSKASQRPSSRGAIGNLGGRTKARVKVDLVPVKRRYQMDELRKAIVMSEVLSPPVALRPSWDRWNLGGS